MKIAVFHQFMDNIGGAEIVTLFLARGLNADIYTTNIDKEKIKAMGFSDLFEKDKIKSIGKVPINAPFRHQLALFRFRYFNANKVLKRKGEMPYDFFIIAGDWAIGATVKNKPNLWYVHSPLNELWAYSKYLRNEVLEPWKRIPYDVFVSFNRSLTKKYSKFVEKWICNSNNTKKRIKRYYGKDAEIINPPIDCSKYQYKKHKNYWLSVNRLLPHKRIEMQLKAFAKLPDEKLIIVGSYAKNARQFELYKNKLESLKPQNVKFRHWISQKELAKLYSECKGVIATAKNEDFGMTPVEAMASGKPVIAVNEGGYKETILDGKTGYLINNINEYNLAEKIRELSEELKDKKKVLKYKEDCFKRAENFDINVFIKKINKEIMK